jgi:hypothetical protein
LCVDAPSPVSERRLAVFMKTLLSNAAAIWNLLLFLAVVGTLVWFFYWFGLRRIIRAKRIASSRDRRMLREAAEREVDRER